MTQAFSGRSLNEITVRAAVAGELRGDDVRIHPGTLRHQAQIAETAGNRQLGANLRRAAELTALSDEDLLRMYSIMRPGRATGAELAELASELRERGALHCAELVNEAIEVYERRGVTRQ